MVVTGAGGGDGKKGTMSNGDGIGIGMGVLNPKGGNITSHSVWSTTGNMLDPWITCKLNCKAGAPPTAPAGAVVSKWRQETLPRSLESVHTTQIHHVGLDFNKEFVGRKSCDGAAIQGKQVVLE